MKRQHVVDFLERLRDALIADQAAGISEGVGPWTRDFLRTVTSTHPGEIVYAFGLLGEEEKDPEHFTAEGFERALQRAAALDPEF